MNILIQDDKACPLDGKVLIKLSMKETLLLAAYANVGVLGNDVHALLGLVTLTNPTQARKEFISAYAGLGERERVVCDFNIAVLRLHECEACHE